MARMPDVRIDKAIEFYYSKIELSNKDICEIFSGKVGATLMRRLKGEAREIMTANDTPIWDARKVNTRDAFSAWGLEIGDLEMRYKKLQKLGMI